MRKYLVMLFVGFSSGAFCASSSSMASTSQYVGGRSIKNSNWRLEPEVAEMALTHLPEDTEDLVRGVSTGFLKHQMMLFAGPTGMGKKTAAYAIAQKYFLEENVHVFEGYSIIDSDDGRSIDGRRFEREMKPILLRAQGNPQFVILNYLDQVIRIKESMSDERKVAVDELKCDFEDIWNQGNIVLVGLCHKTNRIPERISQFFSIYRFDESTPAFRSLLLEYYLGRSKCSHGISKETCDELAVLFPKGLRKVEQIVQASKWRAFSRKSDVIHIERRDITDTLQAYNEAVNKQKWEARKKILKNHSGTIVTGVALAALLSSFLIYKA